MGYRGVYFITIHKVRDWFKLISVDFSDSGGMWEAALKIVNDLLTHGLINAKLVYPLPAVASVQIALFTNSRS